MPSFEEQAALWGDEPEIDTLADVGAFSNPEAEALAGYPGGHRIALGLAIWRSDMHIDEAGDIGVTEWDEAGLS